MRTLLCYLVSLAVHTVAFAAMGALFAWQPFEAPQFSVRPGGGGSDGAGQGEPFEFQGEFITESRQVEYVVPATFRPPQVQPQLAVLEPPHQIAQRVPPEVDVRHGARLPTRVETDALVPPPPVKLPSRTLVATADRLPEESPDGRTAIRRADATIAIALADGKIPLEAMQEAVVTSSGAMGHGEGGAGSGGSGDLPSGLVSNPLPPYPPEALVQGIEGVVLLHAWIRDDGTVDAVKLHASSGNASLDESALATVRDRWRFVPARRGGVAVDCEVIVPVRFRIR